MYKLLSIVCLFLSFTVCGQSKEWNSLAENNYSIQYPNDWEVNKSGLMNTSFILLSQLTSQTDQFRENVNLIIQDLKGLNIDLDKYVVLSESQVKTMITDGNIISSDRVKNKEFEFQKVIYTGKQGIFELKFEQYYFIHNDKAYVLTLTCEENEFNTYKIIGEKILDSFSIE